MPIRLPINKQLLFDKLAIGVIYNWLMTRKGYEYKLMLIQTELKMNAAVL